MWRAALRLVFLFCALFLAYGALPAHGQALPPPILGDPGDPYFLDVPYALPPLDALQLTFEKQWPGHYFLTRGLLSDLGSTLRTMAPRAYYAGGGVNVSVGTQMLNNATPFNSLISYSGGRLSGQSKQLGWSVWGGHIENLDQQISSGLELDRQMVGGALGWRPNAYTSFNASALGYASQDRGPIDRTIGSLSAFVSDRRNYSAYAAFAHDFGAPQIAGEKPSAREAWRLDLEYSRKRLSAAVSAVSWGRLFGPPQGISEQRGQHQVNAVLNYQLSPVLSWSESYVNNGQETPGIALGPMSVNTNLQHRLIWSPTPGLNLQGGLQQTYLSNGVAGQTSETSGLFLQAGGNAGIFTLSGDARREALAFGSRSSQAHVRVGVPLTAADLVFVDSTYFSNSTPSAPSSNIVQGGLGYSRSFADERGLATIQYNRQFPVSVAPTTSLLNNATLTVAYRPLGSLWLGGTLNMTGGSLPGSSSTYSEAHARWVIDAHSDFGLIQRFNSGGTSVFDDNRFLTVKSTTQLSYRLSFGGPIERSLRLDRQGRLTIRLTASAPGGGPSLPLPDVQLKVGQQIVRTDRQGLAIVHQLDPGTYTVSLPPESLSKNYELEGPRTRKVEVGPGEFERADFRTVAWSSVYAVTWSDAEGTGKLPESAYTPLQGIRVRLEGLGDKASDASGSADFSHIKPGRYKLSLDRTSIPRGLVPTTAETQEIEVKPGEEVVVAFGLQGFGRLRGRAAEVPLKGTAPTSPLADVAVLADGKVLGRTDAQGQFDLRIPAGHHQVTLDPNALTASRYVIGAPVAVDVNPDQTTARDLDAASFGNITAVLVKRSAGGTMVPVAMTGVVVNFSGEPQFLYTDEKGQAAFDRLPMGRYTISVDASSIPSGYVLVGPASESLMLTSGERRRLEFQVRPKS